MALAVQGRQSRLSVRATARLPLARFRWALGRPTDNAGLHAIAQQYGPRGFAAFQMVASQTPNRSNPAFSNLFAEGGLKTAVEQGLSWNAHYYEIWETDVTNPQLHPLLRQLAEKVAR